MDNFFIDVVYNKTGTIRSATFVDDNSVTHAGVKGMRWGVRRRSRSEEKFRAKQFGGKTKDDSKNKPKESEKDKGKESLGKKSTRVSADAAQAARLKGKPITSLSNEQLAALTKRMQLEKSYNDIINQPKKTKVDENFEKLAKFNKRGEQLAKTFKLVTGKDVGAVLISTIGTAAGATAAKQVVKTAGKRKVSKVAASTAGKAAARRAAQYASP